MKIVKLFLGLNILLAGLTACSGSSDDDAPSTGNDKVEAIVLKVDKTELEANGTDKVTFTVVDNNGNDLTATQAKYVYIQEVTSGDYLDKNVRTFSSVENGTYSFKAYFDKLESETVTVKVKNRKA